MRWHERCPHGTHKAPHGIITRKEEKLRTHVIRLEKGEKVKRTRGTISAAHCRKRLEFSGEAESTGEVSQGPHQLHHIPPEVSLDDVMLVSSLRRMMPS